MGYKESGPAELPSSTDPAAKKPLGRAGRLEHYFSVCAGLDLLPWVVVSARYHHASGAPLDKPTLFAALDHVVRSQPALASRLEYPTASLDKPPMWALLPSVDLNMLVEFRDEDSMELAGILEAMYAAPPQYEDDMPLWKLRVLRDGTVVFAFEHTIGDGQSGTAFHLALLNALRTLHGPLCEHSGLIAGVSDGTYCLVPPMEEAMDVSVPFTTILREVWQSIWPPAKRRAAAAWTSNDIPKSGIRGASVRIVHYPPEHGKHLVSLARAHKTTLTGTLHAVALVVLSRLVRARADAHKYKTISTVVPISMRRYTRAPPSAFCNHVSSLRPEYPILPPPASSSTSAGGAAEAISADNLPWEIARDFVETLKREGPRAAYTVGLLKLLGGKYEKHIRGLFGKKRPASFELSNLGPFPVEHLDEPGHGGSPLNNWEIDEMLFVQADETLGSAFLVNVAGSPSGGVGVSIVYSKEVVEEAFAEDFVSAFNAGVQGLLASRST